MFENSPAGLVMVRAEVPVTVTREDQHQAAIAHYRPGATVAVELGWCTIRSGRYQGERAIEVRLDGQRVGELTFLMSQRYGSLVGRVTAAGGRPGCAAGIHSGAKGLEITLRLPRDAAEPLPIITETPTEVLAPVPAPAGSLAGQRKSWLSRPMWIAASVFGLIVFFAIIGNTADEENPSAGPLSDSTTLTTTTAPTTTTTTPPPTTTTTTTKQPAPKPKPAPKPAPPPPTTTERPVPPPPAPEPPPPAPEPEPTCHPNYGGCVPVADDVDCAGGSGNGPAYVDGPVRVIGQDVYDLDRDGDGTACDS